MNNYRIFKKRFPTLPADVLPIEPMMSMEIRPLRHQAAIDQILKKKGCAD